MVSEPARGLGSGEDFGRPERGWRRQVHVVIFESDTRAGRVFDLLLLTLILASVVVVTLDSVASLNARHGELFNALEWMFTGVFAIEYLLRLVCVRQPRRYALSFLGIVDFIAIVPSFLALLVPQLALLLDVRILRMLRIFRLLKMAAYVHEFRDLGTVLLATRRKIVVFIAFVALVVTILGTLMYVIEGPENGYTSIPVAIYWAITTMTTVGFGDIAPKTDIGRLIASLMMLMGWGTLAVPTGIVSAEFAMRRRAELDTERVCPNCGSAGHTVEARFCHDCGAPLKLRPEPPLAISVVTQ